MLMLHEPFQFQIIQTQQQNITTKPNCFVQNTKYKNNPQGLHNSDSLATHGDIRRIYGLRQQSIGRIRLISCLYEDIFQSLEIYLVDHNQ